MVVSSLKLRRAGRGGWEDLVSCIKGLTEGIWGVRLSGSVFLNNSMQERICYEQVNAAGFCESVFGDGGWVRD